MDDRKALITLDGESSAEDDPIILQKEADPTSKAVQDFGLHQREEPSTSALARRATLSGNNHLLDDSQPLLMGNNSVPPDIVSIQPCN